MQIEADFYYIIETEYPNWKLKDFCAQWDDFWAIRILAYIKQHLSKNVSSIMENLPQVPINEMNSGIFFVYH